MRLGVHWSYSHAPDRQRRGVSFAQRQVADSEGRRTGQTDQLAIRRVHVLQAMLKVVFARRRHPHFLRQIHTVMVVILLKAPVFSVSV